jgi:alpha-tubulin suppressor-like RCC1 family protein
MAALVCDVCGGKLVMGTGGMAVCDSCGMEHSKDRMQEKVQEIKGSVEVSNIASLESLFKRGQLALENSQWETAYGYFYKVLDINPEYVPAHIGSLCACVQVRNEEMLGEGKEPLSRYTIFNNALKYANLELQAKLKEYDAKINARITDEIAKQKSRIVKCRKAIAKFQNCIVISEELTLGLKSDGTVVAVGDNKYGRCDTKSWQDIIAIAAGKSHVVGLKPDGTVVSAGYNHFDEIKTDSWRDIVAIATCFCNTAGLKSDGTVVVVGDNEYGQCETNGWQDIIAITTTGTRTLGLKSDGTVVSVGSKNDSKPDILNWRDIVAIAAFGSTFGVKIDGTVVVSNMGASISEKISNWRDIVAIAAGRGHIIGLKKDGTVVVEGGYSDGLYGIKNWRDIGPVPEDQIAKSRLKLEEIKRWKQEGLCENCGGEIGGVFTRKCKSCGTLA